MTRVILCRVGERPHVTWLAKGRDGGHATALCELLGAPVALLPLHDGIHLCCDRDGLLLGLTLARRALARSAPWRSEIVDRSQSPVSGDILVARINALDELVDLTELDIRIYLFWLGLEYVLHR